MADDNDWDDLRAAWAEAPAAPSVDVDRLVSRVRRSTRRAVAALALELVVAVTALLFLGFDLATRGWRFEQGLGLGLLVLATAASLWARRGPWPRPDETLERLLLLAEHRARMGIRYALATYAVAGVAQIGLAVVLVRAVLTTAPPRDIALVGGMVVYLGVLSALTRRAERARRKELEEVAHLRGALEAPEP